MKLYQRILICGAARQGNTLLLHLLGTGFRNLKILHGEEVPKQASRPGRIIAGKRPGEVERIGRWLDQWDLGVIFTMRDPRDVICSRHTGNRYWVRLDRWVRAAKAVSTHRDHPQAMVVRYEELLRHPDKVQDAIGSKFGLSFRRPFAGCHQHFDAADTEGIHAMHGARPFDRSRIGSWRETEQKRRLVANAIHTSPDIEHWMGEWDYGLS